MDASAGGGWFRDLSWSDAGTGRRVQALLERTEAAHRRTAARLLSCGDEDGARRVAQFAEWARFDLDEPVIAQRLYRASARLRRLPDLEQLVQHALDDVLSLAGAEQGNVQLASPVPGALTIVVQRGFGAEFLDHFAIVNDDSSACGRAGGQGAQLVITDVNTDPGFEPHRDIAVASGFRAVQSTPLTDVAGRVLGVVSTHYPRPHAPPARDLRIIKRYADLLGRVLASHAGAVSATGYTRAAWQPFDPEPCTARA